MSRYGLRIRYNLLWQSDWHVGSGYGSAAIDRLSRKGSLGGKETPYVPGSQVKGVVRQACEQLTATLGLPVVETHGVDSNANADLVNSFTPGNLSPLLIDRLFGSRYSGECLFFSNALPEQHRAGALPVVMRNSIDRATGTAASQKLFSTEIVPAKAFSLVGDIEATHPEKQVTPSDSSNDFPYEYSLLVAALRITESLGGDRSTGRGRVVPEIESIRWRSPQQPSWGNISIDEALQPIADVNDLGMFIEAVREDNH